MAIYVYWFLLALILFGLELMTGSFYLLIVAISMAIGGVFALFGVGFTGQLTLAALAGFVGIIWLKRFKAEYTTNETNQSLDVGQPVKILLWHDKMRARVFYRGAEWDAELENTNCGHNGVFYIKELRGSTLILTNKTPV